MLRKYVRWLGALAIGIGMTLALVAGLILPSYAQPDRSNEQDGGDIQVNLTITGTVQAITPTTLTLDGGLTILIPQGLIVPVGITPGVIITVVVQVSDTDFIALSIAIGTATATPTSTPIELDTDTPEPTELTSTPTSTLVPTVTPTGTLTVTALACGSGNIQPVAQRLAQFFHVSYAEIMNWHCMGFGFGEIAKAYALAMATANSSHPVTAAQIFAMRQSGLGWGQIMQQFGVSPRTLAPGIAIRGGGNGGPGPEATKDKGHGNDNGNGNGNGDGNGNGNGNGHGNGHDK